MALPPWAEKIEDTFPLVRWASPDDVLQVLPHQMEWVLDTVDESLGSSVEADLFVQILDLSEHGLRELEAPNGRLGMFSLISEQQGLAILLFLCWVATRPFTLGFEQTTYDAIGYWAARILQV